MRLNQEKKLRPRRLISRVLWLLIFNASRFLKRAKSQWRAVFTFLPQKHILRRVFIFLLIFAWLFSGWPRIWQNPRIPPRIEQVWAQTIIDVLPNAKHANDTTGDTLSGITGDDATENPDTTTAVNTSDNIYTVDKGDVMQLDTFDVASIPDGSTISAAVLHLQYGAENGYNGTNPVRYDNGGGLTTTGITPSDITGWSADLTFDLYAAGVDTKAETQNVDIEFTSNDGAGPDAIHFDYVWITITYTPPSGTLTVDIVDSGGNPVASPSMAMGAVTFSFNYQTANGTFGVSTEKIRVENTTANPEWTLTIAANGGSTAFWDSAGTDYDFNDPTAEAGDGGDADSLGGQMTIDASGGTLGGTCSATDITKGSSSSFSEGVTDSVTLLTAGASADTSCYWDLTGVSISQTIPVEQPAASDYSINMTLTVAAI